MSALIQSYHFYASAAFGEELSGLKEGFRCLEWGCIG